MADFKDSRNNCAWENDYRNKFQVGQHLLIHHVTSGIFSLSRFKPCVRLRLILIPISTHHLEVNKLPSVRNTDFAKTTAKQ